MQEDASDATAEAVSTVELEAAQSYWETGHKTAPLPILREQPM